MDKQKIYGFVRNAIAAIGGFLVALGYTNSDDVAGVVTNLDAVIGAVLAIGATVVSLIAKIRGNIDNPTPAQAAAKQPDAVDKAVK